MVTPRSGMKSFAPGRICLFGEHQDYLGLPVIAAAINLGITIEFKGWHDPDDGQIHVSLPDVGEEKVIDLHSPHPLSYASSRDYLVSSINVMEQNRIKITRGFSCEVSGTLPISAGASSSSALVVAWINLLQFLFTDADIKGFQIARWANEAEVGAFGESGGYMDHATSSVGGVLFIRGSVEKLELPENTFIVLGDSLEKKETVENIRVLRANVEAQVERLTELRKTFHINNRSFSMSDFLDPNTDDGLKLRVNFPLVYANLKNAALTYEALDILKFQKKSHLKIGELVNQHHAYLRDYLGISTEKVEALIAAALNAGATGAKINGSGFGGTMFALCKNKKIQEKVAKAIEKTGGVAHLVDISDGIHIIDEYGNKVS